MKTPRFSVAFFWPMYSPSREGRSDNSNCFSSSPASRSRTLTGSSSDMKARESWGGVVSYQLSVKTKN
jgi:hypothetical protein